MVRFPFGRISLLLVAACAVTPLLAAQESRPQTHTVRSGDTLWDLARRYLGDPFLWPEIYRLNTMVVEDPHWIYPDEVLRLSASGDVASVPTTDTPPPEPRDTMSPDGAPGGAAGSDDWKKYFATRNTASGLIGDAGARPYRALRRGEFHSSGFLTEGQSLPFGTLLGRVTPAHIGAQSTRQTASLYTEMHVRAPRGTSYEAGDSLLIVELGAEVPGYGRTVIPTGLARVLDVAPGRTVVSVVALYGAVAEGQLLLPAETFVASGTARAIPVADGVQAKVLGGPRQQVLSGPQDVLFIDKGRSDGLAAGDLFEVRRSETRRADGAMRVPEVMAVVQVIRVGDRSATTRILSVSSPDIKGGAETRQVAKLP